MLSPSSTNHAVPRRGLTLLDTTITVLLLGIMAATAMPQFSGLYSGYRVDAAADRLVADLELAREAAVSRSTSATVSFTASGYTIPLLAHLDATDVRYTVDLSDIPYEASIASYDLDGDNALVFSRYGTADSDATITISAGGADVTVTVDSDTGEVDR